MTQQLISSLTRIASLWLDRHYVLREEAIQTAAQEFCLSQSSFELALDWIFSQWTESTLTQACLQNPFRNKKYAVQILAGTTPAMIAQGFLQGAILNIPQCIKIPRAQPTFARLLYQSLTENSPHLAALIELNTWQNNLPQFYSKLRKADLVLAYGQDETMATLKKYIAPNADFIAHGQVESAAIIFKEAANIAHLKKLAYDMLSYDQRGCLSPRVTLVEADGELSPAACAKVFAEIVLPQIAAELPRGGLFAGEAAEILHQRIVYQFRGQVYCGQDWTVCYDEKKMWPKEMLPRFMVFKPFATTAALVDIIEPIKNNLISIGYAGTTTHKTLLQRTLTTRICRLGEMQNNC